MNIVPGLPFCAAPLAPTQPTRPGWRWHLLTDIARLATGHTPSRSEPAWWGGDIQWLQLSDIRALDGRRAFKTLEQINALGIENSSSVVLPEGTVCMSRTASVGFVTIMGCPMATSQDFVNWVCGPDLDPEFLMHLLVASRRAIQALGSGATHHSIYFQTVEAFSVCVPLIADQRRIATDVSCRIAAAERVKGPIAAQLDAAESLGDAYLREVFDGPKASGWTRRQLGDVLKRNKEIIHPGDRNSGNAVFVGLEHIEPNTGRRTGSLTIELSKMTGRKPTFLRGQIVYGYLRPYLNKVWVAEFDGCSSVDQFAFAVDQELADTDFVAAFMRSATFLRRSEVVTTTGQLPRISVDEIAAVEIELPPTLADQRRISVELARRVSGAEQLATTIREELAAARVIPAAVLREAFNGVS